MSFLLQGKLILQYSHHFLPAISYSNQQIHLNFKSRYYLIVTIQMKGKGISFAQVLMKKDKGYQSGNSQPQSSLLDILNRWEENPDADYTLYLGQPSMSRQRISQNMFVSNTSKNGMFDSWIERQGISNKENSDSMSNRYSKEFKQEFGPKKILLHSKGQSNNIVGERKQFINKSVNNYRSPVNEVELNSSNDYEQDLYNSREQSKRNYRIEGLSIEIECEPKSHKNEKPSFQIQNTFKQMKNQKKNSVKVILEEYQHPNPTNNSGKIKVNELQHLVDETDNIHEEIAELAHQFVLQQKKKSEQEEEELLLSLEQAKRLSFHEKKTSQKEKEEKEEEELRNRIKTQTKKEIEFFLKHAQTKVHVPTFGGKRTSFTEEPKSEVKVVPPSSQDNIIERHAEVGYSFATNLAPQPLKQSNYIPLLQIGQAPTIPLIQEIASQRHQSQANEEIQNMYFKWKQEQDINQIESENIKNIESVNFFKVPQIEKQNIILGNKDIKIEEVIVEKEQECILSKKVSSEEIMLNVKAEQVRSAPSNKTNSGQKPQIMVNIPFNFSEKDQKDPNIQKEEDLTSGERNEIQKDEYLVFSESSKKGQLAFKQSFQGAEGVQIKLFTNQNRDKDLEMLEFSSLRKVEETQKFDFSPSNLPNRDIYLSQKEEGEQVPPATEAPSPKEFNFDRQTQAAVISQIQKIDSKKNQKQSPSHYFKTYGLNKIYSNNKTEEISQPNQKELNTSQFDSKQGQSAIVETKEVLHKRPDTKQFSFGHAYNPMNILKLEAEDPKTNSKGKSSGHKITLTGSNKSKEKKNSIKIQSYANTTMFSTIPVRQSPKEAEKQSSEKKSPEEEQEFDFDF